MTILFQPKESLLSIAGTQFDPVFTAAQLLGSNDSLSTEELSSDVSGGKEAMMRVTLNRAGYAGMAGAAGTVYQKRDQDMTGMFYYDKFDLSDLAASLGDMAVLHFVGYKPTSISMIVSEFKMTFGIELIAGDVVNQSITWTGDTASILLEASSTSLGFKGSMSIDLIHVAATEVQGSQLIGTIGATLYTIAYIGQGAQVGDRYYLSMTVWVDLITNAKGDSAGHPTQAAAMSGFTQVNFCHYEGYNYAFDQNGKLNRHSLLDTSWERLATSSHYAGVGYALTGISMIGINGKIIIHGGRYNDGSNFTQYKSNVEIYDIETNTWSSGTSSAFVCTYHSVARYNGKMYVVGGNAASNQAVTALRSYDLITNTWTTHTSNFYSGIFVGFINLRNRLIVCAGHSMVGTVLTGLYSYNPVNNVNTEILYFSSSNQRLSLNIAGIGDTLYVLGGTNPSNGAPRTHVTTVV